MSDERMRKTLPHQHTTSHGIIFDSLDPDEMIAHLNNQKD